MLGSSSIFGLEEGCVFSPKRNYFDVLVRGCMVEFITMMLMLQPKLLSATKILLVMAALLASSLIDKFHEKIEK